MGKQIKKNVRKRKIVEKLYTVEDMMALSLSEGLREFESAWVCFDNRKYSDAMLLFKSAKESYSIARDCAEATNSGFACYKAGKMIGKCNINIRQCRDILARITKNTLEKPKTIVYEK